MACRVYQSRNPYTLEVLANYEFISDQELEKTLEMSHQAFISFSKLSFQERAVKVKAFGNLLRERKEELARLMSIEMGKAISLSRAEILKSADCCDYYAENAENLLKPIPYDIPGSSKCYAKFEPVGTVLIIMPFNFPLWMPIKTSIPHLMAGNTIILKHAENLPQISQAIDQITNEAGLYNEYKCAFLSICQIERVISDSRVQGVSLTGSVRAGQAVAQIAARNLKKSVLELGGSDPFIVLKGANLELAIKSAVAGRLSGCGQVCTASKRFIIEESIYESFVAGVIQELDE